MWSVPTGLTGLRTHGNGYVTDKPRMMMMMMMKSAAYQSTVKLRTQNKCAKICSQHEKNNGLRNQPSNYGLLYTMVWKPFINFQKPQDTTWNSVKLDQWLSTQKTNARITHQTTSALLDSSNQWPIQMKSIAHSPSPLITLVFTGFHLTGYFSMVTLR